jgi:hypothetical protein
MFAAAVAGAPLTDLYSMYLSVYWNTGGTDARIFEISQGRMEVPPWQDLDSYMANSPVHNIEKLNTPMLVMFGDGGRRRRLAPGHRSCTTRRAAQPRTSCCSSTRARTTASRRSRTRSTTTVASLEWFGHYLKGEEAAPWIREGVRFLDRDGEKRPNRIAPRPIS